MGWYSDCAILSVVLAVKPNLLFDSLCKLVKSNNASLYSFLCFDSSVTIPSLFLQSLIIFKVISSLKILSAFLTLFASGLSVELSKFWSMYEPIYSPELILNVAFIWKYFSGVNESISLSRLTIIASVGVLTLPTTCLLKPTLYILLDQAVIALVPFIPIFQSAIDLASAAFAKPLYDSELFKFENSFCISSLVID